MASIDDDCSLFIMDADLSAPLAAQSSRSSQRTQQRTPFLISYHHRPRPRSTTQLRIAHEHHAPSDRDIHIHRWLDTHTARDYLPQDEQEVDGDGEDDASDVHDADNSSDDDEIDEDSAIFIRRRVHPPIPTHAPPRSTMSAPAPRRNPRSLRVSAATPALPVVCLSEANADLSSISDDVVDVPRQQTRVSRHPHHPSTDFDEEFWTMAPSIDDLPPLTVDEDDDSGPASTSTRSIPISPAVIPSIAPVTSFCGWETSRGRCRPMQKRARLPISIGLMIDEDEEDDDDLFWKESPKDAARRERERGRMGQEFWRPLMDRAIYGGDA